jgi:predicted small lipoprotein YifL
MLKLDALRSRFRPAIVFVALSLVIAGCAFKGPAMRPDASTEWEKDQPAGLGNTENTCNCLEARF